MGWREVGGASTIRTRIPDPRPDSCETAAGAAAYWRMMGAAAPRRRRVHEGAFPPYAPRQRSGMNIRRPRPRRDGPADSPERAADSAKLAANVHQEMRRMACSLTYHLLVGDLLLDYSLKLRSLIDRPSVAIGFWVRDSPSSHR